MVLVPPGEFLMGSTDAQVDAAVKLAEAAKAEPHSINRIRTAERPQHRAVVEYPFRMGRTEVTIAEFRAFVTDTGYVTRRTIRIGELRRPDRCGRDHRCPEQTDLEGSGV